MECFSLTHFNIKCTLHLSSIYEKVLTVASKKEKIVKVVLQILTLSHLFLFLYLSPPLSLLLLITLAHIIPGLGYYSCQLNALLDSNLVPLKAVLCTVTRAIYWQSYFPLTRVRAHYVGFKLSQVKSLAHAAWSLARMLVRCSKFSWAHWGPFLLCEFDSSLPYCLLPPPVTSN